MRQVSGTVSGGDVASRRAFLQAGGAGMFGVSAGMAWHPSPAHASPALAFSSSSGSFGRAKSVVVLFLYGAPSQIDTLDPKPMAPQEVRGEFQSISTSLPGIAA